MTRDQSTLVLPGGETSCIYSGSTPFAFQVFPGDSDKLVVYFQGGGACWDEKSSKDNLCTTDAVPQPPVGIFNRNNPLNKFKSYTIVHIMYCSGDLHSGDIVRPYNDPDGFPQKQKGLVNTHTVINWILAQSKSGALASTFSDVLVTGCSAGSMATQMWAKQILTTLAWKRAAILPDSYAGVFPAGSFGPSIAGYGFCTSGFLSPELYAKCIAETLTIEEVNVEFVSALPTVPIAFIESKVDNVQQAYYIIPPVTTTSNTTLKGDITPSEFYSRTNELFGYYNKQLPNFLTYLVDGQQHCFTCYDHFFTADGQGPFDNKKTTTGLTLNEWVSQLPLDSSGSVDTVCEGTIDPNPVPLLDNTYCSSKVYPKHFVETY